MKTCLLLMLGAAPAIAQDSFTIDWIAIGGSSHTAAGGEFSLTGFIGQPVPGESGGGSAGEFSLTGGFWTLEETPMELGFAMRREGGTVTLTWDNTRGIPVVLESSANLNLWAPVVPQPAGPPFTESAASRRYYRLRRSYP
jgi:hypothetical protein